MRPSADDDGAVLRELLQGVPLRARRQNRSFPRVTFLRYGHAAHQLIPPPAICSRLQIFHTIRLHTRHTRLCRAFHAISLSISLLCVNQSCAKSAALHLPKCIPFFLVIHKVSIPEFIISILYFWLFLFRILVIDFHFYLFLVHINSTKRVFQFSISIRCYSFEEINIPRSFLSE